jgi:type I restriction enzyme R subunit
MENISQDINEYKTRKKYIDPLLKNVDWEISYIKEEVNPIKSDFKNKNYMLYNGKAEKMTYSLIIFF